MSVLSILSGALFGSPETPGFKPVRQGVLDAITELFALSATEDRDALRTALRLVGVAQVPGSPGSWRTLLTPEAYRSPGFTDLQAAQAMVNALTALAGGGEGHFPGKYTLNGRLHLKSNVTLRGGVVAVETGVNGLIFEIDEGQSNIHIDSVFFDGQNIGIMDDMGGTAIGFRPGIAQAKSVRVTNCVFDMPYFTPLAPGANDPRFARNPGESDADYKVRLNGPGGLYKSFHCVTFNNVLSTFTGNITQRCGGDAFGFYAGLVTFTGNLVMFCGDGGLALNLTPTCIASGNMFFRCDLGAGIGSNIWVVNQTTGANPFSALTITGNMMYGCSVGVEAGWFAIYLDAPTNTKPTEGPRYLTVSDNYFTRCKSRGFGFFGREDTIFMHVTVSNNKVVETGSALYDGTVGSLGNDEGHGIYVNNCYGLMVSGNHSVKNIGSAFKFSYNRRMIFDGNTSNGNNVGVTWGAACGVHLGDFFTTDDVTARSGNPAGYLSGKVTFTGSILTANMDISAALGQPGIDKTRAIHAWGKSAGGTMYPLKVLYMNGDNIRITNGDDTSTLGQPWEVTVDLGPIPHNGW